MLRRLVIPTVLTVIAIAGDMALAFSMKSTPTAAPPTPAR